MGEPQRQGLFSGLSMGRAARSVSKQGGQPADTSEGLVSHPLLGAPSPTPAVSATGDEPGSSSPSIRTPSGASRTASQVNRGSIDALHLPYKPRQRHSHQASGGSSSSVTSTVAPTATSSLTGTASTSPVTPAAVAAPPPTLSTSTTTSTSATFALPVSAMESSMTTSWSDSTAAGSSGSLTSPSAASATSRLQLQSLKAAAQKIGLGNGTMGMAMIDAIFEKGQVGRGDGTEWADIFKVLVGGKAVLLLPTTASSSLPITPQTLRDHIVLLSPPIPLYAKSVSSRHASSAELSEKGKEVPTGTCQQLVTLSGLLGTVYENSLTVESILPAEAPLMQVIRDPIARGTTLQSLRPSHDPAVRATEGQYPHFDLSSDTASLPFPPLSKGAQSGTGPSDGKSGPKDRVTSSSKLGRMNPFMSLFGGGGGPASATSPSAQSAASPSRQPLALTPDRPQSPSSVVDGTALSPSNLSSPKPPSIMIGDASDTASIRSDGTSSQSEGYHVMAYTVSKPMRTGDTHKSLTKAIRAEIKDELARMPEKTVDRVIKLVTNSIAPSVTGSSGSEPGKADDGVPKLDFSSPAVASQKLQDFVESVYDDMVLYYRSSDSALLVASEASQGSRARSNGSGLSWAGRASVSVSEETDEEKKARRDKVKRGKEEAIERESTDGAERVEAVVCRLLYNRLFSPIESDDARHDEALASRIAALNMLDLSLDHLGLITRPDDEASPGEIADGLVAIVDQVGDEMQKLSLPSCISPKDKAEVLIKAHKLVVDGLAALPPIQLRPEGEPYVPEPRDNAAELTPREEKSERQHLLPNANEGLRISMPDSSAKHQPNAAPVSAVEKTPVPPQKVHSSEGMPNLELDDPASSETATSPVGSVADRSAVQAEQLASSGVTVVPSTTDEAATARQTPKPSTSGADLILPIIIFAMVKSNPAQLASQLMYLRRYRSAICLTGEASYALVNLTAVVEFLEHVDLAELGLGGDSDKVMSIADLSPIGLEYMDESNADAQSIVSASSRLRGRVFQVSELAGSAAGTANKAISSVLDSSWSAVSAVRGLIGQSTPSPSADNNHNDGTVPAPASAPDAATTAGRPGLRARQASTFSLASVTASVASIAAAAATASSTAAARTRSRASSRASELLHHAAPAASQGQPQQVWKGNQEMIDVSSSRPESVRERDEDNKTGYPSDAVPDSDAESPGVDGSRESESILNRPRQKSDTRSIMSVSSMMSRDRSERDLSSASAARKEERASLSDRLANIGGGALAKRPSIDALVSGGSASTSSSAFDGPRSAAMSGTRSNILPTSVSATGSRNTSGGSSGVPLNAAGPSQAHSRRSSLLGAGAALDPSAHRLRSNSASPALGRQASQPDPHEIEPPIERFMTCEVGDIRLSEIGSLLRDYRRLAGIVQSLGESLGEPKSCS